VPLPPARFVTFRLASFSARRSCCRSAASRWACSARSRYGRSSPRASARALSTLTILDFVSADAATYAQIRARLERAGKPIGPLDTLIAAQAVARKLTLVSNNRKEFGRVPRLAIENWADRA